MTQPTAAGPHAPAAGEEQAERLKASRADLVDRQSRGGLAFDHISHRYVSGTRRTDVLDDVSFDVPAESVACVVGPSGCGKSTLLSLAAGLQRPSSGAVRWDGNPVKLGPNNHLGMAFQQPGLFPWMTVRQNVAIGLRTRGHGKHEALRIADEFIETVGLSEFKAAYPSQLSGGMAQRVGIARALALRPSLLLLDEPFAAVDAFTRLKLQQEFKSLLKLNRAHGGIRHARRIRSDLPRRRHRGHDAAPCDSAADHHGRAGGPQPSQPVVRAQACRRARVPGGAQRG